MSETSSPAGLSRASKAFLVILGVVVLLTAVLSGAWFYLAGRLDDEVAAAIDAAAADGTEIVCEDRDVFGFPFRIGILCESTGLVSDDGAVRMAAGSLRTAAQIYRPDRIVAELDGPLAIGNADVGPLIADWALLNASAQFWTDGLERFSLQTVNPTLARGPAGGADNGASDAAARTALGEANDFEIHARRRDGDLDVATTLFGTRLTAPAAPSLSPFAVRVNASVADAAGWLDGDGPDQSFPAAMAGERGTLRTASVEFRNGAALSMAGDYAFDEAGRLSGRFELGLTDVDRLVSITTGLFPELGTVANAVGQAIGFAGRAEGDARILDITVNDGRASIGMIPLATIPPVGEWQG